MPRIPPEVIEKNRQILETNKTTILSKYLDDEFSINELGEWCTENIGLKVSKSSYHGFFKPWLQNMNLYRGLNCSTKRRREKIEKTTMEKHGTLDVGGYWKKANAVEYKKLDLLGEKYKQYCKQVSVETKKNIKCKKQTEYCEYTGVRFCDFDGRLVNPNDPMKKTIDHKTPVIVGFLNNIDPTVIGSIENLAYVIRYVNNIKGSTDYISFLPIANKIKERLQNAGY
jgi:hypothetical protein